MFFLTADGSTGLTGSNVPQPTFVYCTRPVKNVLPVIRFAWTPEELRSEQHFQSRRSPLIVPEGGVSPGAGGASVRPSCMHFSQAAPVEPGQDTSLEAPTSSAAASSPSAFTLSSFRPLNLPKTKAPCSKLKEGIRCCSTFQPADPGQRLLPASGCRCAEGRYWRCDGSMV